VAQTPKAQKDTNDLIVIFALSATARIKTARKTLVKLSLDVLSRPHLKRDGPSFSYLRLNWTTELLNLNGVKIIVVTSFKGVGEPVARGGSRQNVRQNWFHFMPFNNHF